MCATRRKRADLKVIESKAGFKAASDSPHAISKCISCAIGALCPDETPTLYSLTYLVELQKPITKLNELKHAKLKEPRYAYAPTLPLHPSPKHKSCFTNQSNFLPALDLDAIAGLQKDCYSPAQMDSLQTR